MTANSPADEKAPSETKDADKLRRWRSEFFHDYQAWDNWLVQKKVWEDYYDGEQWTTEEKQKLKQRGQPEVVINLIKPRIDGVIGDFLGRRVMMRARDRGTNDFDTAKHITEAVRYVEDHSLFDEQETQLAEDLFKTGVGWYKVGLEFDHIEPEIRITYIDNDDVILDRRCRKKDLSDAKRLYQTIWVEKEDLLEIYPQFTKEINEASTMQQETFGASGLSSVGRSAIGDDYAMGDNVLNADKFEFETFLDPKRDRIRLISIWERQQKRIEFAFHPDIPGTVAEVTDFTSAEKNQLKNTHPEVQIFVKTKWQLNAGVFIANAILEDIEDTRPHDSEGKFPFARALGHLKSNDFQMPYGLVRQYIDPQTEYNKRRSKLLHKTNVNQIIAEEGAFADHDRERIREEAARPDGVMVVAPDRRFEINRGETHQSEIYLLELAHNEVERSGVSREFIGTENKVLSGRAIGLRQVDGNKQLRPFFAALRQARRRIFEIALEEMQQYWTAEKLIKITDDPESGQVILNQRVTDPVTGKQVILNNLRLGKYDIKIDEDLETPNQRQESFEQLAQLGQVALQAGQPFPLEMMIKSSNLPNKKEWLEAIAVAKQEQQRMMLAQMQAQAAGAGQNGQMA